MSSARLNSLSRIIASESERTSCTHMLMIIAYQFRVGKWTKKPSNLSSSAIASEKLAKHILNIDETCPIDSRRVSYFDEHGHSHTLGSDLSCSRRHIGKMSLNSTMLDCSSKKYSSNWVQAKRSDDEFKLVKCKEQEVFYIAGMRGKRCMQFPELTKEE